jgi:hypothetical protein
MGLSYEFGLGVKEGVFAIGTVSVQNNQLFTDKQRQRGHVH